MTKYKRYVDDSNQIAVVPPPGAKYDANTKTVVHEQVAQVEEEADDGRLARILKEIANDVQPGIIMEEDHPSQHTDGKMPILDMKVSINEEGFIVYQHFEKPVSSKKIMNVNSAQSMQCKKNVHVQEVVSRAGKSSKMSEHRLLLGVKCPQSFVEAIISHCTSFSASNQAFVPHFYPQIRIKDRFFF